MDSKDFCIASTWVVLGPRQGWLGPHLRRLRRAHVRALRVRASARSASTACASPCPRAEWSTCLPRARWPACSTIRRSRRTRAPSSGATLARPMGAQHTIYLIRHGETAYNARRILQTPDVPLSERRPRAGAAARGAPRGRGRRAHPRERSAARGDDGARAGGDDAARRSTSTRCSRSGTSASCADGRTRSSASIPSRRATSRRAARASPPSTSAWRSPGARIQEHAAAAGGPLAVVTHGLVCRDLVAHHLELPPELAAPPDALGQHQRHRASTARPGASASSPAPPTSKFRKGTA